MMEEATDIEKLKEELEECKSLLKGRTQELMALQKAAGVFGSMARGENVYLRLTEQAAKLLNTEMCAILLYNEEEKALVSQAPAYGLTDEQARSYRIPLASEEIWKLWQENEYLALNDVPTNPLVDMLGLRSLAEELKVRSTLLVLMRLEGRSLGVIQPSNKLDGSPFDESDIRLLSIFASQVAVAVENARLREEEGRRLEQAETMARIGMALASSLDLPDVLDAIAEG
ncbi:MAG: GAF domain-containing protein, partial [Anaerolineae bacterium]